MIELGEHQLKAVRELKNGCVLKGGVGTGKSRVALAYYVFKVCEGSFRFNGVSEWKPMKKPKDLYIITTAKKRDNLEWEGELAKIGYTKHNNQLDGVNILIDSWNNIGNYVTIDDSFFIFDEQRLVGSGAWVKAFLKIAKQNQWIMLSATPGDNWMDYIPVFIANGFYKNRTEFVRTHVVFNNHTRYPKVDHYVERGKLDRHRRRVLVEMPYQRHTIRHTKYVKVDFDKVLFERVVKDRWNIYEQRPIKDISELFAVMRKLVNTDPSRLTSITTLLNSHPRLIIFYNFNYELEILRKLSSELNIVVAEWNGHKHEEIPEGTSWIYLVQYTAGAEGWNCVSTDAMIFYSLNYSYRISEQGKGRIDRMNTPYTDLYYYVFRSASAIDNAIMKALNTKKNFNEKAFIRGIYGESAHF